MARFVFPKSSIRRLSRLYFTFAGLALCASVPALFRYTAVLWSGVVLVGFVAVGYVASLFIRYRHDTEDPSF
jgi:hypothetical protein